MTEQYPSDAELNALSGTSDAEQEVLYVAAGESPYYTSFYKMLHRLLNVARRAGDLRVYKDGGLTFGVRAGKFMDGVTARTFAGVGGQGLVDNATNYIYITADGALTVNQTGFPDPAASPHLPLATITTLGGGFGESNIADERSRSLFRPTGLHIAASSINAAGGVAGLDANGRLPIMPTPKQSPLLKLRNAKIDWSCACNATAGWAAHGELGGNATLAAITTDGSWVNSDGVAGASLKITKNADGYGAAYVLFPVPATFKACPTLDHILFQYQILPGAGASAPSQLRALDMMLYDGTHYAYAPVQTVGSYTDAAGLWQVSQLFGDDVSHTGVDLSNVTHVGVIIAVPDAGAGTGPSVSTPSILLNGIWFVQPPAQAEIAFRFDGGYASHYRAATMLANRGLKGTFYVSPNTLNGNVGSSGYLTLAQCQRMRAMGHAMAVYGDVWGSLTEAAEQAELVNIQNWLIANGMPEGSRHMVQGGTTHWTPTIDAALYPGLLDTSCVWNGWGPGLASSTIQPGLSSQYAGRYLNATGNMLSNSDTSGYGSGTANTINSVRNIFLPRALNHKARLIVGFHDFQTSGQNDFSSGANGFDGLLSDIATAINAGTLTNVSVTDM